jgi:hypothetical protein
MYVCMYVCMWVCMYVCICKQHLCIGKYINICINKLKNK